MQKGDVDEIIAEAFLSLLAEHSEALFEKDVAADVFRFLGRMENKEICLTRWQSNVYGRYDDEMNRAQSFYAEIAVILGYQTVDEFVTKAGSALGLKRTGNVVLIRNEAGGCIWNYHLFTKVILLILRHRLHRGEKVPVRNEM